MGIAEDMNNIQTRLEYRIAPNFGGAKFSRICNNFQNFAETIIIFADTGPI